jgi:hypothetical protein
MHRMTRSFIMRMGVPYFGRVFHEWLDKTYQKCRERCVKCTESYRQYSCRTMRDPFRDMSFYLRRSPTEFVLRRFDMASFAGLVVWPLYQREVLKRRPPREAALAHHALWDNAEYPRPDPSRTAYAVKRRLITSR